jgi:hypothetical protein
MPAAAIQAEILRLHYAEHGRATHIARHLGIHRESVRKVVRRRSAPVACNLGKGNEVERRLVAVQQI